MITKNTFSQLGLLYVILFFTSCISTKRIYRGLTEKSASLVYLHDTPITTHQSGVSVAIQAPHYSGDALQGVSQLKKNSTMLIPLIVYNELKRGFTYQLGQASLQEDVLSFVHDNLIGASYRNGVFRIDSLSEADLTLEVSIDSTSAQGPYLSVETGMYAIFTYITTVQEKAGPGLAYSRCTYRLRKEGEIVLEETIESHRAIAPLVNEQFNIPKLRTDYTAQLAESLSWTFKDNIDRIVARVNQYIRTQYSPVTPLTTLSEQERQARRSFRINPLPQAKVIVYRPANNQYNHALPVTWNDSTLTMLTPGAYQVLTVPLEPMQLCTSQQICKKITPSLDKTTYLILSMSGDGRYVHTEMRLVKPKTGSFQLQKLKEMTN